AQRIGFLFELDRLFLAGAQIARDDARQAIFAFEAQKMVLEHGDIEDQHALAMGDEIGPVFGGRIVGRGGDDLVVLGAIGIGADIERAVTLLELIFAIREARRDKTGFAALYR